MTPREFALPGFFATLGRLPGTWLALTVTVTAGLCEGLGLTLFIPLLETLDSGGNELGKGGALLKTVLDTVHIPMNLFTMLAMIVLMVGSSFAIAFAKDGCWNGPGTDTWKRCARRLAKACFFRGGTTCRGSLRAMWSIIS